MWIRRTVRGMGWGRNPLRRTTDRVEAWLTLVLVAVTLVVAPLAASRVAHEAYRDTVRAAAWESQHLFQAEAVLLQDARQGPAGDEPTPQENVPAIARWTDRDGIVHTGTAYTANGTRAGTTISIWIDDRGLLSGPPSRRQPRVDAAMAAILTVCGIAVGLAGIRRIMHCLLDRRRMRAWQLEWMTTGPGWSRRR
jgi:hypothetical protein